MLLLWACLLPGNVFAQDQKVTLHFVDAKVSDVFDEINRQTGLGFVYNRTQLQEINPVTLQVENVTVDAALKQLLADTPFEYYFEAGSIVIREKKVVSRIDEEEELFGLVVDKNGHPIPGVTVLIKGTTIGVSTDMNGHFRLIKPVGTSNELLFSFVGMKTAMKKAVVGKEIKVVMEEEATEMAEVVVTGYQVVDRRKSTAAVTSKTMEELMIPGASSLDQMLLGQIPDT